MVESFHLGSAVTHDDLARLPNIGADDVLYLNSARPIQMMVDKCDLILCRYGSSYERWEPASIVCDRPHPIIEAVTGIEDQMFEHLIDNAISPVSHITHGQRSQERLD